MKDRRLRHLFAEIAGAILTLFVVAFALERAYGGYKTPLDRVLGPLQTATDTTLLIVGNSHAGALGTLPLRNDDRVYNASVGGQDLYRSYLILASQLSRLPHLREVIVALDYDAIGYNFSVFNQDWQDRQYYPYTGRLYHDGPVERLLAGSSFFRANRDLSVLFTGAAPADANPILPVGDGRGSTPEGCRKRAREHSEVKFRENLIEENSGYLREMASLGERSHVTIHFLNAPKSLCYRDAYSPSTIALGRAAILNSLGSRVGEFHDSFDDHRFWGGDFLDDDHLSPAGARKLLDDLASRTASPLAPGQDD